MRSGVSKVVSNELEWSHTTGHGHFDLLRWGLENFKMKCLYDFWIPKGPTIQLLKFDFGQSTKLLDPLEIETFQKSMVWTSPWSLRVSPLPNFWKWFFYTGLQNFKKSEFDHYALIGLSYNTFCNNFWSNTVTAP